MFFGHEARYTALTAQDSIMVGEMDNLKNSKLVGIGKVQQANLTTP